jgi:hypothetical protein
MKAAFSDGGELNKGSIAAIGLFEAIGEVETCFADEEI